MLNPYDRTTRNTWSRSDRAANPSDSLAATEGARHLQKLSYDYEAIDAKSVRPDLPKLNSYRKSNEWGYPLILTYPPCGSDFSNQLFMWDEIFMRVKLNMDHGLEVRGELQQFNCHANNRPIDGIKVLIHIQWDLKATEQAISSGVFAVTLTAAPYLSAMLGHFYQTIGNAPFGGGMRTMANFWENQRSNATVAW